MLQYPELMDIEWTNVASHCLSFFYHNWRCETGTDDLYIFVLFCFVMVKNELKKTMLLYFMCETLHLPGEVYFLWHSTVGALKLKITTCYTSDFHSNNIVNITDCNITKYISPKCCISFRNVGVVFCVLMSWAAELLGELVKTWQHTSVSKCHW